MKLTSHIIAGVILGLSTTHLAAGSARTNSEAAYLDDLFAGRIVPRIQIEIPPEGIQDLSGNEGDNRRRPQALATVREGGQVYTNVEIHLKGGAGSYRPVNNNPGLTLNFEKMASGQTFHGLKKFSLNNSVQDPTYLNEKICRELFNAADSPAARAGFATVELNGRDPCSDGRHEQTIPSPAFRKCARQLVSDAWQPGDNAAAGCEFRRRPQQ